VLTVAKIAGIQAAKRTSDLIPLCHPLPVNYIDVDCQPNIATNSIDITATVRVGGKTGVEMEALTAVTVAGLTIYDMAKAVDRGMQISQVRLAYKEGGKSGIYDEANM
jgi:cyclic pyranopterin phosphate synthase